MTTEYRVDERSLIHGLLKRTLWNGMLERIPTSVSANRLTVLGTLCGATASIFLLAFPQSRWAWAAGSVLYFAYLCLDNLDGAQARRTGGGTPLGEVLDHWLDSVNGPLLFMAAAHMVGLSRLQAVLFVALASLSYVLTYWEQRVAGCMVLGAVGNTEGLVAVSALCAAGAVLGPPALLQIGAFGISAVDALLALTLLTLVVTAVAPIVRVRKEPGTLAFYGAVYGSLLFWGLSEPVPGLLVETLFVLLTPIFAGRALLSRVLQRPDLATDHLSGAGVVFASVACAALKPGAAVQTGILLALVLCAAARAALDLSGAVRTLGGRAPGSGQGEAR